MAVSALLAAASVASLNLCADEYLLLLGRAREIASVSFLSRDPLESPLWRTARGHHANHGSMEQVVALRPSVVLTVGGGGRASGLIATRLGIRAVDLKPNGSFADIEHNLRAVAAALGEPRRAHGWIARLRNLRATTPSHRPDAIWLTGGGDSLPPESIGTEWLRLAGLEQRPLQGGRASLETLLVRPPQVLVQSDYRVRQVSGGTRWLQHPIVRNLTARRLQTDGRAWTCMGPLLIGEVERLRKTAR